MYAKLEMAYRNVIRILADADMAEELNSVPRVIRDRSNPFEEFDDGEFFDRFRLSKASVQCLLEMIKSDLEYTSLRNNFIPPILKLLTALRFFATGNFQRTDGDLVGINQATTCRIIHKISKSIAKRKNRFISFPANDKVREIKRDFFQIAGFPNVIGCIDGSHVPIVSPGGDQAELYRNRKGYFSINVQAVCDAKLCFTNIVCRWPGSTHDARIFDNCSLCSTFECNLVNGLLLGDSGYACRKYLMTPLLSPSGRKERNYNVAHIATRSKVERMFGVWKQRFRCLRIPLRTRLENTLVIIVATACLHNFATRRGEFLEDENNAQESNASNGADTGGVDIAGNAMRQ